MEQNQLETELAIVKEVNKALQAEIGQLVSTAAELRVIINILQNQQSKTEESESQTEVTED